MDIGTSAIAAALIIPHAATEMASLRFQVGARTLWAIQRRLVRLSYTLDDVLIGTVPALPILPRDAQGYLVTSMPEALLPDLTALSGKSLLGSVRQRYTRYHIDLSAGAAAWLAGLSANARSGIRRKAKKLAAANGGLLDIRRYHDADAFAVFHPLARKVSATTYQEKLLESGLPDDGGSVRHLVSLAKQDRLRAWLLFLDGTPIAYLCCTAEHSALLYTHVGHDPAHDDLSPGAVLQVEALRDLFTEQDFARFDFTEGEGQHKRQFSTGGTACVDVVLLRRTLANRATLAALRTFDRTIAYAGRAATHAKLKRIADKIRR
ncbi:GNAT family N-acetyltransferase [Sphingomonas sp. R86520]|uniref:GNAT family N-acetyltransferase n=1 Tax=Sphingomonas sp. R86520 TaxID=3093859 RepID=UPI0036D3B893